MPDLFIEEAENSQLIIPITLQLIDKAFFECEAYLHENNDFYFSFNFSAMHFKNADFLKDFHRLCLKHQISSHQIMIELTERQLLNQDDMDLVKCLKELRQGGFRIAIDDFGTGHASISYLQNFPFNYLKIDQSFIQAIGTGAITETLNEAIIHLAKQLQLNIIAEGVETSLQVDYLKSHQVQLMQGWYFSHPLTAEKLMEVNKRSG